ncbi:hypothetical protein EV182_003475, partial [Spiromyces aspiralis]
MRYFAYKPAQITPAHDPKDYECGKRHGLPSVSIFDPTGRVIEKDAFKQYAGMSRWDVRARIVDDLKASGHYLGRENSGGTIISVCSRSGDIIEPIVKPQWYVRCGPLARTASEMVARGEITLHPKSQEQEWFRWLDNIQDWCISRQLWWGHRIPAFCIIYQPECGRTEEAWVAARNEDEAILKFRGLQATPPQAAIVSVKQDEDVLDTWFSAGLLPLSQFNSGTRGLGSLAPSKTKKPLTDLLETGQDILFFWVARMVMLCSHFSKIPPFRKVLLHPMVKDAQGRKMSKSLGNVIDPLHIIEGATLPTLHGVLKSSFLSESELKRQVLPILDSSQSTWSLAETRRQFPNGIPKFGADSLRMALLAYTQQTVQINLDVNNVKSANYFCNKLWNTFKFIKDRIEANPALTPLCADALERGAPTSAETLAVFDRYVLCRLAQTIEACEEAMRQSTLYKGIDAARRFIQHDLCDNYIELSKPLIYGRDRTSGQDLATVLQVLVTVLENSLRLLHPYSPYITEELWQKLYETVGVDLGERSIMTSPLPSCALFWRDTAAEAEVTTLLDIIGALRSLRQKHGLPVSQPLPVVVVVEASEHFAWVKSLVERYTYHIKYLGKATSVEVVEEEDKTGGQRLLTMPISSVIKAG